MTRCCRSLAMACALVLALLDPTSAQVPPLDSSYVRFQLGLAADVTNEQYFEESYSDTLFLGRRLSSSPEVRSVAAFLLEQQRVGRDAQWWLRTHMETKLGEKLQRLDASAQMRSPPERSWRAFLEPSLALRSDESFGENRRELRSRLAGRLARRSLDEVNTLELAAAGELVRSDASSTNYVLDRDAADLALSWNHAAPYASWTWRSRYAAFARAFPDSADRDHYEHRALFSLDWAGLGAGGSLVAEVERRLPRNLVYSTRDDYWAAQGDLGLVLHRGLSGGLELTLSSEGFRYHLPDSVSYFDYELVRGRLAGRFDLPRGFSLAVGPTAEAVFAAAAPGERYFEWGGGFDLERSLGQSWWALSPSAGVRNYTAVGDIALLSGHSDYGFLELQVLIDQALLLRSRARISATMRLEKHGDSSQDARSLYFSVDLRRLL